MKENIALLLDLYELTMAQGYWRAKKDKQQATFDLFVRQLPFNRGYLINAGLEDILEYIDNLRFNPQDIAYLKKQDLFTIDFLDYLKQFKFSGDIWAMPEGEIFFANQPIIRVTANIIEAQILESLLLNIVNLQTMIATKASRVVSAAKDRKVFDFALRRTHGQDAALKVARCSFLAGFAGTSNVLAGKIYGIPIVGTMAHSYVMCFKRELESFLSYAQAFPRKTTLLVDTYNTKKAIDNAINVGLMLKKQGHRLLGIRLDSGNLVALSKMARKRLDRAGLAEVEIFASGNLDEYKIYELLKKGASIDNFGVGTKMGVSQDAPFIDVIYKISEVMDEEGNFFPTMKLSQAKTTLPGRKQVYRIGDSKGKFLRDILALEREKIRGRPLLKQVVEKGEIIYAKPTLNQIRNFTKRNLSALGEKYKRLTQPAIYPVIISRQLNNLIRDSLFQIKKRQNQGTSLPAGRQGEKCPQGIIFLDIDTQYDFMNPRGKLYIPKAEELIPNLRRLFRFAEKNNIPVVSSLDTHRRNDPEFKHFPPHCIKGTRGYKKMEETFLNKVRPVRKRASIQCRREPSCGRKQIFITKHTIDVFSNPQIKIILKPCQVVYVFGVALDYCVKAACLGLVNLGIKTYLVRDATKAVSTKGERETLRLLKQKGIIFLKTEEVIESLKEGIARALRIRLGLYSCTHNGYERFKRISHRNW